MSKKQQRDDDSWLPIRESLDDFQPAQLAARLREYLVPRIPQGAKHLDERTRLALLEGVSELLAEHAGAWYRKVHVQLGNEVLGDDCRCHGFFNQGAPPDLGVESNIQRILSALGATHAWLCTLDTYFRSLALPQDEADRAAVLSDAVRRVIDFTVEATRCEKGWPRYAHQALGWLLESQGIPRTRRLERALDGILRGFTSGSAPSANEARQAANTLALAAMREDPLPRSYSDEGAP
jgi:hypothetical protein